MTDADGPAGNQPAQDRNPNATGSLAGRTVVVAGASSGVGLATANLLHDHGAHVHALARREGAIRDGAGAERLGSGRLSTHTLDISDQHAVARTLPAIGEAGGIDVLVLAAGLNVPDRSLERLTPQGWDELIAVNLSGAFYTFHAARPALQRSRGLVVAISSVSGQWPDASGAAYQAAKAGLVALGRAASFEEHQQVRFSTILPGLIDTPILDRRPEPPPREVRDLALQPADVAQACLFLATLPAHVHVPELTMVPSALQALGRTGTATPPLPG